MNKRRWIWGIGLLAALFAAACSGPSGTGDTRGTGQVTIALAGVPRVARTAQAVGDGLPADVERIEITCTGADMDPVSGDLPLDGSPLVLTIPSGLDRRFAADAWAGATHRMAGSSILASLAVNETATVSISLLELGTLSFATPPPATLRTGEAAVFEVDMTGFENPSVLWSVNGRLGGHQGVGLISASGVYTAPANVPTPAEVTIRAASGLAPDLYAEAIVAVEAAILCGELLVDSTADTVDAAPGDGVCADATGACTLRAAVQEANACPGAQTAFVPASTYLLTLAGAGEDAAATGDLDVTDDLTVSGAGADVTVIDANALDRVFHAQGVALTVEGVTVRNGLAQGATCMEACGGGILATGGALTLLDAAVEDNRAIGSNVGNAGGIYATWTTLTLTNSTVANNVASGPSWSVGGGILKTGGSDATIINSTISGNASDAYGGGMQINGGTTTFINSTVTGNRAGSGGSGLYVKDVGNAAAFHLFNTVVAGQAGSGDCGSDGPNPVVADGFNIDGDGSCDGATTVSPGLGPLASNGGPTATHALSASSSAVNAGDNATCPATDQRGVARDDGFCDVGAYEYRSGGISVVVVPATYSVTPGGSQTFTATVSGTVNTAVTWSVEGSTCSDIGTIDIAGVYTAGVLAGDCTETVRATSQADNTVSATAALTVSAVTVSVLPAAPIVNPAASQVFTATVTGAADTSVTWNLDASTCGAAQGSIATDGTYTAGSPSLTCTDTVRATSNADPVVSVTETVTVAVPVIVNLTPSTWSLGPGGTVTFSETVTGAADPSVTWTVEAGTPDCGAEGGTIVGGTYTADNPAASCQAVVRAASVEDPTVSATATVEVGVTLYVTVSGPSSVYVATTGIFTATVVGSTNAAVSWYVNDVAGGNATVGTVAVDGTYTAPVSAPTPDTVIVKAVSDADGTTFGTASVRVTVTTCLGGYLTVDSTLDAADAVPGNGSCDDGAGNCTLRAAIEEANACPGMDLIDVPVGTYPLTLGAALGITDDLTVSGAGAASTLVDGAANGGARIFSVGSNLAVVTLQDLTLQNANTPWGGGALSVGSNSPTVVWRVVMRGNQAAYGGAVSLVGNSDLTVIDSTITGNQITDGPGGSAFILFDGDHLTIRSSTISYNGPSGSGTGSGVILEWNNAAAPVVTIENSTIVGNSGVGIHLYEAQATITNSTITNNSADGVRAERNAAVTLTNSILYGNGPNCSVNGGTITSGGHNLDSRNTCGFAATGDQVNTDPMLGALVDNGGPTKTRGLLEGSPALNAGDTTACPATDQRGVARSDGACDIGAFEGSVAFAICLGANVAVNSTTDAVDAQIGDGICDDGTGACTLRAAIQETNACVGADAIDVPAGMYVLSLGALTVSDELALTGAGAASTIVDGNAASGVFSIAADLASVGLADLTVRNGSAGYGAGILLQGGTPTTIRGAVIRDNTAANAGGAFFLEADADLTLEDTTITGNRSGNAPGGSAFFITDGVDLTIRSSTISYNELSSATGSGAGVILDWSYGSPLSVTIENSTIAGNNGMAVRASSALTVRITNSTLTNNTVGLYAGAAHAVSQIDVTNSILSRNGTNCQVNGGTITSGGHNIDSLDTCGFAAAGDQVNTDPLLGALVGNGGPTKTRGLLAGSPALDAGDAAVCSPADQRGEVRSDGACDIGAVEGTVAEATCLGTNWGADPTVDSTADAVDADVGDGICDDGTGNCTLRAAIQEANACVGADVIDLPAGTYALALAGAGEDAAATGDLDITDELTVNGAGAAVTIVDGGAPFDDRIFHVLSDSASFGGLTLQNVDSAGNGGAIYAPASGTVLAITDAVIADNTTGGGGAGVYVGSGCTLTITGSTLSGNAHPYEYGHHGAAVYAGTGATVRIEGNTLVDDSAAGYAEAVYGAGGAVIRITDATVSNSRDGTRGVAGGTDATVTLTRATISGNTGGGVSVAGAGSSLEVLDATVQDNTRTGVGSYGVSGAGIYAEGTVLVEGSTISGNQTIDGGLNSGNPGGGIYATGPSLTVRSALITGNRSANGSGGGIWASAATAVSVVDSTVSGNVATAINVGAGNGGGIYAAGPLTVRSATFSSNTSCGGHRGGAVYAGGVLDVENATFSGNSAWICGASTGPAFGGAVAALADASIRSSTFSGNDSNGAGALGAEGGTVFVTNTIIDGACGVRSGGLIVSSGHNIDGGDTCGFATPTDLVNTDPVLDPLADNGGPTWTHRLQPGSPAVDAGGDAVCPATDQRGEARPQDGDGDGTAACDIGAVELVPAFL